jgi:hypothetical protein
MKTCNVCKSVLPDSAFRRRRASTDGLSYTCKVCATERDRRTYLAKKELYKDRAYRWGRANSGKRNAIVRRSKLKNEFGLSEGGWQGLWDAQGGRCGLCGGEMSDPRHEPHSRATACVDHDHRTGMVRGLLCSQCNGLLGHVEKWTTAKLAAWLDRGRGACEANP